MFIFLFVFCLFHAGSFIISNLFQFSVKIEFSNRKTFLVTSRIIMGGVTPSTTPKVKSNSEIFFSPNPNTIIGSGLAVRNIYPKFFQFHIISARWIFEVWPKSDESFLATYFISPFPKLFFCY